MSETQQFDLAHVLTAATGKMMTPDIGGASELRYTIEQYMESEKRTCIAMDQRDAAARERDEALDALGVLYDLMCVRYGIPFSGFEVAETVLRKHGRLPSGGEE